MSAKYGSDCIVGVDIGGTKILVGVVDGRHKVLGRKRKKTPNTGEPLDLVKLVAESIREIIADFPRVKAVGVGVPGFVKRGRVFQAYNIGCEDFAFTTALRRRVQLPVFVENDCNLFTLGIHRAEFSSRPQTMVGMFLGTGVGGGLIINGEIIQGANGTAGELGQLIVDRSGPRAPNSFRGSLESSASHVGLVHQIRCGIRAGNKTKLQTELGANLKGITANHLRSAVRAGDRLTTRVVHRAGEAVGLGVAGLISTLAPERIVLGGGVMDALGGKLMPIIRKTARANVLEGAMDGVLISRTKLRGDGAIIGAAAWARDNLIA